MAVPTITSVSPNRIYTGGQMITVSGTGFRTRYAIDPATPHPWPNPLPTVAVTVGGRAARKVVVSSSTSLTCITSSHDPGAVTVTVQNLDSMGVAIVGETLTRSGLLTFVRVDLTIKDDLARIIEALVTELSRQVIANVSVTTSVDYGSDPNAVSFAGIDLAALPALCLSGPEGDRNRFYSELRPTVENVGVFSRRTTFETQDLQFRLLGLDNSSVRGLNLHGLVTKFFQRNNNLVVSRDPSDTSKGEVSYELEGGPFTTTSVNNASDLRAFSGPITIKGYQFEDVAGVPGQLVIEQTTEADDIDVVGVSFS